MSGRPRLLDLMCGAGGCSVGYDRAGFDVTGCDIEPHPDYPFPMIVGDAMTVLACPAVLDGFDVVHASPPCPRYSAATNAAARGNHPDLVPPTRAALIAWGGLFVIENVPGAPMTNAVKLCGSMFGLKTRRHRLFDTNGAVLSIGCDHDRQGISVGVYGNRDPKGPDRRRPDGTGRGVKARDVAEAQTVLGIDWMSRWDDLADAIPPAYTQFIGEQLLDQITRRGAA